MSILCFCLPFFNLPFSVGKGRRLLNFLLKFPQQAQEITATIRKSKWLWFQGDKMDTKSWNFYDHGAIHQLWIHSWFQPNPTCWKAAALPCLAPSPLSSHTLPSPTPSRLAPPTCLVKPHSVQPSPAILYLLFTSWLLMTFSHLAQEPLFLWPCLAMTWYL